MFILWYFDLIWAPRYLLAHRPNSFSDIILKFLSTGTTPWFFWTNSSNKTRRWCKWPNCIVLRLVLNLTFAWHLMKRDKCYWGKIYSECTWNRWLRHPTNHKSTKHTCIHWRSEHNNKASQTISLQSLSCWTSQ